MPDRVQVSRLQRCSCGITRSISAGASFCAFHSRIIMPMGYVVAERIGPLIFRLTAVIRFLGLRALALVICIASVPLLAADGYPTKPVRMLVGFPPGAGADITARLVAGKLSAVLGRQVIVDNRPGAGSNIAAEIAAHAVSDGYTMLLASAALVNNVSLYEKLPFDLVRDFAPVALAVSQANVLAVHPSLPVRSVEELIALAKSKAGGLLFGSGGIGTTNYLAAVLFNSMAGLRMAHVGYKGGGPAMLALVSGEVELMFAPGPAAVPLIKAGKIRALAVTTTKRSALLPELPTVAEAAGLRGYEAYAWFGILVPVKTPRRIVERLNKEIVAVLEMPEVKEALFRQGLDVSSPMTPEEFGAYIKSEIVKWADVIKASGIKWQ